MPEHHEHRRRCLRRTVLIVQPGAAGKQIRRRPSCAMLCDACLVPFNLAFCIIFEMAIAFKATLYDPAEFVRKCIMVKQMV